MSAKGTSKVLEKLEASINEGNYYEAHQMYRSVLNRYIKQKKYEDAKIMAFSGALALLRAQQYGSGADMAMQYLEVLKVGQMPVVHAEGERILSLFRQFPDFHSGRNDFMRAAIQWTSLYGVNKNGEPALHHLFGEALLKDKEFEKAERHLLLGTKESAVALSSLITAWSESSPDPLQHQHLLLLHAVLKFLYLKRINEAGILFQTYINTRPVALASKPVEFAGTTISVFVDASLLNFTQYLILVVQFKAPDAFTALKQRYAKTLEQMYPDATKLISQIGSDYFGVRDPQAGGLNIGDLMSAFFGGGGEDSKPAITELD